MFLLVVVVVLGRGTATHLNKQTHTTFFRAVLLFSQLKYWNIDEYSYPFYPLPFLQTDFTRMELAGDVENQPNQGQVDQFNLDQRLLEEGKGGIRLWISRHFKYEQLSRHWDSEIVNQITNHKPLYLYILWNLSVFNLALRLFRFLLMVPKTKNRISRPI